MKKRILVLSLVVIATILLFGIISINVFKDQSKTTQAKNITSITNTLSNTNSLLNTTQEIQNVTLSFRNYEYVLTPNTLKVGIPVKITVDTTTVTGCMRDIVIGDLKVRKYVTPGDNVIEFTPNKEGTFLIACSMNMGRGYFTVTSNGVVNNLTETSIQAAKAEAPKLNGGCGCGSN